MKKFNDLKKHAGKNNNKKMKFTKKKNTSFQQRKTEKFTKKKANSKIINKY
jgi:hypothetical protein